MQRGRPDAVQLTNGSIGPSGLRLESLTHVVF